MLVMVLQQLNLNTCGKEKKNIFLVLEETDIFMFSVLTEEYIWAYVSIYLFTF